VTTLVPFGAETLTRDYIALSDAYWEGRPYDAAALLDARSKRPGTSAIRWPSTCRGPATPGSAPRYGLTGVATREAPVTPRRTTR
jgi:hypothetical protein